MAGGHIFTPTITAIVAVRNTIWMTALVGKGWLADRQSQSPVARRERSREKAR